MPRFEQEGFDPRRRRENDALDRTVPEEDRHLDPEVDLDFNRRQRDVIDRQDESGINPCDYRDPYAPSAPYNQNNDYDPNGYIEPPAPPRRFESERPADFYTDRSNTPTPTRAHNRERTSRDPRTVGRSHTPTDKHGKPPKKGKGSKKAKVGLSIFCVLLALIFILVGCATGVLGKITYNTHKENEYVTASNLKSDPRVKNVLLLGVDARPKDKASASRSDTMMLISVDSVHHTIKMTSFLRDTWVYIPCKDMSQRLNAACQYGGYSGVVDTIEYNFGVKIDNYVVADFEMFQVLVDAIGGVEVKVTKAEAKEVTGHPKRYGNVKLQAGKHNLTGKQALAYCRIRKIDTDFVRTKRQRTVMNAIIKKMKSSNPFTLYKMASNAAPYIETDMTKSELCSFVAKAGSCATSTHQARVPFPDTWWYDTINGNSVIAINKEENKKQLIDFIYNKTSEQLDKEEAAAAKN